jgi:thiol-disulfide isomerase/thioredoxin|eukprot:g150.t1
MASFKEVFCGNTVDFQAKVAEAKGQASNVFVLFTGAVQESTGRSWCGDCVRADPVIKKVMGETKDSVLLVASCDRSEYRDPNYVYRKDGVVRLTCVPTLMNWNNPAIRLNDSQSQQEDLVRELILGD